MINKKKKKSERFSSEPTLTIARINIEGITRNKEEILSDFCRVNNCDVLCIQENHRDSTANQPNISGMKLIAELSHNKLGSSVFVKPRGYKAVLEVKLTDCSFPSGTVVNNK
jgi:hypothetical protein